MMEDIQSKMRRDERAKTTNKTTRKERASTMEEKKRQCRLRKTVHPMFECSQQSGREKISLPWHGIAAFFASNLIKGYVEHRKRVTFVGTNTISLYTPAIEVIVERF
ncbi:unnamed protein product [Caenorhabditis nigoni]